MKPITVEPLASPLRVDENGVVRVGATRVTLDSLVNAYREGSTAEEIVEQFPTLLLSDVHAAVAYYLTHQDEVEKYLAQRLAQAKAIRRRVTRSGDQRALRDRLLARHAKKKAAK